MHAEAGERGDTQGLCPLVLLGCSVVMMLASSAATAGDGGVIAFSGAVVEFTCSVAIVPEGMGLVATADSPHTSLRQYCGEPATGGAARGAYWPCHVDVVHLSGAEPDRVLRYFANYVRSALHDSAHPVLVTQTYE